MSRSRSRDNNRRPEFQQGYRNGRGRSRQHKLICWNCQKPGHIQRNCWYKQQQQGYVAQQGQAQTGFGNAHFQQPNGNRTGLN